MSKIEYNIGNSFELIKDMSDNSVDAVVTDPPYEINFLSAEWDRSGIAFNVDFWKEVKRVMKPGTHACIFGFPRTHHRLMCALEDAGFDLRDVLMWLYGSGFPKTLDISKAIDKMKGAERKVVGEYREPERGKRYKNEKSVKKFAYGGFTNNRDITAPATPEAIQWNGWKTSLKPSYEPIILVRKPISEKNVALNVLKWETGGLNIDACRIGWGDKWIEGSKKDAKVRIMSKHNPSSYMISYPHDKYCRQGRYPSNVLLTEESADMLDRQVAMSKSLKALSKNDDGGNVSRFFYAPKISPKERGKSNKHPTVKPIKLIEHLVKLITPPNSTILDPFVGSGTTLKACQNLGFNGIGFEVNPEYESIIRKRCHLDDNLSKWLDDGETHG